MNSSGLRRLASLIALLMATALVSTGCSRGEPSDPNSLFGESGVSADQAKQDYAEGMDQVQQVLNAPDEPPLGQIVAGGKKQALNAYALRWDQATKMASQISPPKDVAAEHRQLVAAMTQIGKYNHQIAAAAPKIGKVKRLAKNAQNSAASKQFGAALDAISRKGYLTDPKASQGGLDGSGTLDGDGTSGGGVDPETGTPLDDASPPNG